MSMVIENHTQKTIGRVGASTGKKRVVSYEYSTTHHRWGKNGSRRWRRCNIASIVEEEKSELV